MSDDELDRHKAEIERMREIERSVLARFPIGSSFQYLGREMRVSSHVKSLTDICPISSPCVAGVFARYLDSEGVIREQNFDIDELLTL